jgi:hypothetical protein
MESSHNIEAIIEQVRALVPSVVIEQWKKIHPGDDDGLWFFRLPGISHFIQIESSTYDCPFLIEHTETRSSEGLTADSVAAAASCVVSYLRSIRCRMSAPFSNLMTSGKAIAPDS